MRIYISCFFSFVSALTLYIMTYIITFCSFYCRLLVCQGSRHRLLLTMLSYIPSCHQPQKLLESNGVHDFLYKQLRILVSTEVADFYCEKPVLKLLTLLLKIFNQMIVLGNFCSFLLKISVNSKNSCLPTQRSSEKY